MKGLSWSRVREECRDPITQAKAFVAFKIGLSVSLGTLLSLTPGYSGLWSSPFNLADQCIFTILGGANLTVGGFTHQLYWRLIVGAAAGAAAFSSISAIGGSQPAQAVLLVLFVYTFSWLRVRIPKADTGLQFATLACIYAVDDSYRSGNVYGVDQDALKDLLRSWAFGGAISMVVNFLVMPVKASSLIQTRIQTSLSHIHDITAWLFISTSNLNTISTEYTPSSVRRTLNGDFAALQELQESLSFEVSYSRQSLDEREKVLKGIGEVHASLVLDSRDGQFMNGLPEDLREFIGPAVDRCARDTLDILDDLSRLSKNQKRGTKRDEETLSGSDQPDKGSDVEEDLHAKASAELAKVVLQNLCAEELDFERLAMVDRATHCLDATLAVYRSVHKLSLLMTSQAHQPKKLHFYLATTLIKHFKTLVLSPSISRPKPISAPGRPSSYVLPPSPWDRILKTINTPENKYAYKVTGALCCLLAMLWSPSSRPFFLDFAVRNSTIPLLLALRSNLGFSVLAWLGQLIGAIVGILWACMSMRIFRGVGKNAYSVPGMFFFEWMLGMMVGHRMLGGPDFFAVTAMNACAIFIVIQYYTTGGPFEQSLPLHLGYMLTTSSIAIAIAIPFQLLIFPEYAKDQLRKGSAQIMRQLAHLSLDQVELSSAVLWSQDTAVVTAETERLRNELRSVKDTLWSQDFLVEMAAVEFGKRDGFHPARASALVEALHCCVENISAHVELCADGPFPETIRAMLDERNEAVAQTFAESCSSALWCLAASWTMKESPPAGLPSVDHAGRALLQALQAPSKYVHSHTELPIDPHFQAQLRRLWALTLTLVNQRADVKRLLEVMGPDWASPERRSYGHHSQGKARPTLEGRVMSEVSKAGAEQEEKGEEVEIIPELKDNSSLER